MENSPIYLVCYTEPSQYPTKSCGYMKEEIRKKIATAIADATEVPVEECFSLLEAPKSSDHGDLAFPCFQLARTWKTAPPVCAKTLREKLQLPPEVESATETGPFLNFRFHRARYATGVLTEISTKQERHGVEDRHAQTIIVEYSSPNIAKPFHVGHLRTTLIGNSLDRVLRHRGYNVISINHLGDWGTQFGFVWAGCKLWGKPETDSVAGLVDRYIQATTLKAEQEKEGKESDEGSVNEMARKYFLDLENNVPYARDFWQWCLDISLEYFRTTYERLNVRFDHYTGESF
ncbi:MAG: arginine--tRNA ligase, partial [Deltaproteobacteria bacterium]|nr:arginine--tRNA ligase [Deltaproteobacteria bacterium]